MAHECIVEVIRCKDCKYCEEGIYLGEIRYSCVGKWDNSESTCAEVELDDYCSYAERKDEQ